MTIRRFAIGALGMVAAGALAASAMATPARDEHLALAREAARSDLLPQFNTTCGFPDAVAQLRARGGLPQRPAGPRQVPPQSDWYAPPYKIFDNLYWVGTKEHSAWALTTSEGIILIDTLYEFAVEPEIVEGLRTLGLDPARISHVIVTHGHGDHAEGARLLQDRFGSRIVMSRVDWEDMERRPDRPGGVPRRDIEITGDRDLTVGDTTVSIVFTPGHTLGTLSLIFTVKDHGQPIVVAYSGGTGFNFPQSAERYQTYAASAGKMRDLAAARGASVILTNHTAADRALELAPIAQAPRALGANHPFVSGTDFVSRYFTVLEQCALATGTLDPLPAL